MKVFIGCGSNPQIPTDYLEETKKVCQKLCELDCDLVFGAYSKGMMGICYQTFTENNKKVYGANLTAYKDDLINLPLMINQNFNTSFDRLNYIFNASDIFLFLPGATGTLNELFGIMEESKTNKHNKKIIIYNYKGFYNEMISYINILLDKGFAYENELNKVNIVDDIEKLERVIINERN